MKLKDINVGDLVIVRSSGENCNCHFWARIEYPFSGKEYTAEVVGIKNDTVYCLTPKGVGGTIHSTLKPFNVPKYKLLQHNSEEFTPQSIVRKKKES